MTRPTLRLPALQLLIASVCLCAAPQLMAANYFKCKGPDGSTIFSDTECPDSSEVLTEKTLKAGALTGHVENAQFHDKKPKLSLEEMLQLRAQLAQALGSLNPLKLAAVEHRMSNGEWARQMQDLGFEPKTMKSSDISKVKLGKSGSIIANLDAHFGDGKLLVLTPTEVLGGTQYEWQCAANFSPLIMEKLPCESRKIHQ